MPDATTILFLLIALTAGLARGFSGFGAAVILMPPASPLVGPQMAATVLLLVDIVLAAPMIPKALPRVSLPQILVMLAGAAVTVPIGAWLLKAADRPMALGFMAAHGCSALRANGPSGGYALFCLRWRW